MSSAAGAGRPVLIPGLKALRRSRLAIARDLTLGTVFERLAESDPERMLVDEVDGPAYAVRQAADRVARWAGGIASVTAPGDVVVVATANGYDQLLLCAAASRAGCPPAPVNDRMRTDEIDHVVADAEAGLVLRSVDDVPDAAPLREAHPAGPGEVGAIFYTSGTTGEPKGAELTHRALVGQMNRAALVPSGLRHDEAVISLPMAHIMGFVVAVGMAFAGVPVRFLPRFEPSRVLDEIEDRRASVFVGVPAMYRMLLDAGAEERDLRSVRMWLSGADAMPAELSDRFVRMGAFAEIPGVGPVGKAVFVEGYGMVETGGSGAIRLAVPGLPGSFGRLGFPVPGYKTRIVDDGGAEVGRGQIGELQLRGPGLLKGYRGDSAATSAVLTDDGWLRTGDLVRRGPVGGAFSFEGRAKDIIVRGGYNVYAVEVEQALETHPDVAEAAVVGVPDERLGEVPVAAVRLRPGSETDPEAIIAHVRERLSSYKVPTETRIVEDLPRTGTRKLQRAEVRELFTAN